MVSKKCLKIGKPIGSGHAAMLLMPGKLRVLGPGENSAKLPLLTQRPLKRKTSTTFFRVKAIGAKEFAYRGEVGPPDIAPHKLRGPKKGKSECEKQKKLGLRTQKRS